MSQFTVAAVFSNHMILQQGRNINVFGLYDGTEAITVSMGNISVTADITDDRWRAVLPPFEAGCGYTLTVVCGNIIRQFTDVAIGEVWLAGGQSNMELELQNCKEWPQVKDLPADNLLRFYYTQKKAYLDDSFFASEAETEWSVSGSDAMRFWSAVGYFFGAKLRAELNVPVGIIGCNWGGTSASAWMDTDTLTADRDTNSYVQEYLDAIDGKSEAEQVREFNEYTLYHEQFERRMAELYTERPDIEWDEALSIVGECRWPGPMNCANPYRPAGLYECMLSRVAPYSLRGFIYYQGESDEHKPTMYHKLFSDMISCWRRLWEDDTLPLICVQLPMHRYKNDPDRKNWPLIREAQYRASQTVGNVSTVIAIDQGEWNEIHPKAKSIVGDRLALQALCNVYNMDYDNTAFGPVFRSCIRESSSMRIILDHADGGLVCRGEKLTGFELAGADRRYFAAEAVIDGSEIIVRTENVAAPVFVRYLWTNYADVTLFGNNGIPVAPFRSSLNDGSENDLNLA